MKSDEFIREVDEDLRQDKMMQLWDRYGLLVIGVVVAIIGGTAGIVGWQAWQDSAAQAVAREYEAAIEQIGEDSGGLEELERFAGESGSGFAAVARLQVAALSAADGDLERARSNLDAVINDSGADPMLRDLAAVSLASRQIDEGSYDEANELLAPLAAGTGAFRNTALELLAMKSIAEGDLDAARDQLGRLADDALLEDQQRRRVEELLAAIGGESE